MGIAGPIASVSSSKPLTAKPDAVNGFDLSGKFAVKCVEAELRADASKFSRVIDRLINFKGTTLAHALLSAATKSNL